MLHRRSLLPGYISTGRLVSEVIDECLDSREMAGFEDHLFQSIGSDKCHHSTVERQTEHIQLQIAKALSPQDPASTAPGEGKCSTSIQAKLMKAWLEVAGDPGINLVQWIEGGARAVIAKDMLELDWLFPRVGPEETLDSEELG